MTRRGGNALSPRAVGPTRGSFRGARNGARLGAMTNGIQAAGYGPPGGGGFGPPGGGAPGGYGGGPPGGGHGGPPGGYGPPGGFGGPPGGGPMGPVPAMPGGPFPGGPVAPPPAKKSNTGLIIGLVVGALLVVGAAVVGIALYLFSDVGKDKSIAHEHLPSTCDIVVRADIEKIQALPAFQTHVKPALDELTNEATQLDDPDAADLRQFLIEARLDPSKDIDEAVACVGDPTAGTPKFAVILGGEFSTDGIVDAAARRGESTERVTVGGRPAVRSKSKKTGQISWLGQAEDGAIVFTNDEALLAAAIQRTDAARSIYKLDVTSELSFVVASGLLTRQQGELRENPLTQGLTSVTGVSGALGFAVPGGQVRLVTASPASATTLEKDVAGLLALGKLGLSQKGGQSKAGELEALQSARTSVQGNDVVVDLPWTPQGVDQAMKLVGDALREAQRKKGA